jgi:hypothetical protein
MLRSYYARYFFLVVILFLPPAAVLAQHLVMPSPNMAAPTPPDPDLLPPPPQLDWGTLAPKDSEEEPAAPAGVIAVAPQPEDPIALPPPPVIEPPASNPPTPADIELAKPEVEVWREESLSPQIPPRQINQLQDAYVTGIEPVWLRVQFNPLAAGKRVVVKPSRGITLDPPQAIRTIPPNGECLILAQLAENVLTSHIIFYCQGVKTVLPVVRASLAKVEEKEAATGGGQ